ncbi:hypothetical protein scyTo_0000803 [Scyliorhinus torazame]|uniref:Melanocortin 2 receptor accessory protein n=1 Tax=Scyliorhinus torazame TaxID=75743 RepID=A0A401P4I9_SCYTO|nr:hypothetical protein [Scyliorhinus torazame]
MKFNVIILTNRYEMSEVNPIANKTTDSNSDYIWRYEYYDDEPVSFEGLKAHKYSIVIGFWVGLAVFVIFMFFVLTLLTKTGAPHPERSGNNVKTENRAIVNGRKEMQECGPSSKTTQNKQLCY